MLPTSDTNEFKVITNIPRFRTIMQRVVRNFEQTFVRR